MKENLNDLSAFMAVARERSFTRAAAKQGTSQAALSQTISNLEKRLKLKLLNRTTRSVTPTEAGERLMALVGPALDEIDTGLTQLSELRDKPAGTIRISADEYAIQTVLWPVIKRFLKDYPEINIELTVDFGLIDIVQERYDAGVRRGGLVGKDMIAMPISPEIKMVVVSAPDYLAHRSMPVSPDELTDHACINLRLPTQGGFFAWRFVVGGRELKTRVEGQLVFNTINQVLEAALEGYGLAYIPADMAKPYIEAGRLVPMLQKECMTFSGYYMYYTSRLQSSAAFALLLDALRYRG